MIRVFILGLGLGFFPYLAGQEGGRARPTIEILRVQQRSTGEMRLVLVDREARRIIDLEGAGKDLETARITDRDEERREITVFYKGRSFKFLESAEARAEVSDGQEYLKRPEVREQDGGETRRLREEVQRTADESAGRPKG